MEHFFFIYVRANLQGYMCVKEVYCHFPYDCTLAMRRNISNVLCVIGAPLFGSTLAPRRSIAFRNSAGTWSRAPGKQFGVLDRLRDRHTRPARWSDTLRIRPVRWRKWNRIRIDLARLADPIDTHTLTHRPTGAADDNTQRPKLASGKNSCNHHSIKSAIFSVTVQLPINFQPVGDWLACHGRQLSIKIDDQLGVSWWLIADCWMIGDGMGLFGNWLATDWRSFKRCVLGYECQDCVIILHTLNEVACGSSSFSFFIIGFTPSHSNQTH